MEVEDFTKDLERKSFVLDSGLRVVSLDYVTIRLRSEFEALDNWISVKDRLPDTVLGNFICCLENESVIELSFSNIPVTRWFHIHLGELVDTNPVTHWQPLPKNPTT